MGPNLVQLQSQLEGVGDSQLRQALGMPGAQGLPQFLLMGEFQRRQQMRQGQPLGHTRPTTMRQEMFGGFYQPVPPPPVPPPDQGGIAGLLPPSPLGQTLPQAPAQTQAANVQSSLGF